MFPARRWWQQFDNSGGIASEKIKATFAKNNAAFRQRKPLFNFSESVKNSPTPLVSPTRLGDLSR
jgi:hypothetical protein